MATAFPFLLIGILVLLVLFMVLFMKRKDKRPPDYYLLFIMGIIWIPLGIASGNPGFSLAGLVLMIIGLANKDKWKKNRRDWRKEWKEGGKVALLIALAVAVLLVLGLLVFWLS